MLIDPKVPGAAPPLDAHLRAMLGPDAEFREGQREAIEAVIGDGARALVVQRTGWGKSLVYWIATRVRRDTGHGPTLIVSPLLAPDAQPDRDGRPARARGGDDQLRQRRRVGGDRGAARRATRSTSC